MVNPIAAVPSGNDIEFWFDPFKKENRLTTKPYILVFEVCRTKQLFF